MSPLIRAAVIQDAPPAFNAPASLALALHWTHQAAATGAQLAVFPEAFLGGGYPKGLDFGARLGMRSDEGRRHFQLYFDNAINVPGPETAALAEAAQTHNIWIVIGAIERDGGTLYCSALYFSPQAGLVGKHRKLMPTALERLIWGFGDGSTIPVIDAGFAKLGAIICWENYMPMLRMAMYAQGVQLYCAPTVDDRETWLPTMRHIAIEGRCFVLSACQFAKRTQFPDWYPVEAPSIRGNSVIVDPFGTVLAGPLRDEPGILTADLDLDQIARGKYDLDVAGHYARPDVFELTVRQSPNSPVMFSPYPAD